MTSTSQIAKLSDLRARTDRELLAVIDKEVQFGLALTASRGGHRDTESQSRAEKAYMLAATLLPTITSVADDGKRMTEVQLERLRRRLDRVRASAA
jgi:hypothetical protein